MSLSSGCVILPQAKKWLHGIIPKIYRPLIDFARKIAGRKITHVVNLARRLFERGKCSAPHTVDLYGTIRSRDPGHDCTVFV